MRLIEALKEKNYNALKAAIKRTDDSKARLIERLMAGGNAPPGGLPHMLQGHLREVF